jgi:hypothetical protein
MYGHYYSLFFNNKENELKNDHCYQKIITPPKKEQTTITPVFSTALGL